VYTPAAANKTAAPRQASVPISGPASIPRQIPSTMPTPRNPVAIPAIRRAVGRSSGNSMSAKTIVMSGTVPIHTPASTELILVSPKANNGNGMVFSSNATTAAWPQVAQSRGNRSRDTRTMSHSAMAPKRHRHSPIQAEPTPAANAILISRKLEPHTTANTRNDGAQA
jgi:hypothetical protein